MSKNNKSHPDYILLTVSLILVIWGITTLATCSIPSSLKNFGYPWHYIFHQLMAGIAPGILLAFFVFWLPLKSLKKWSFALFGLNLIVLTLVFLPKIGVEIGGAKRWIKLGPILFQPSEFLKITFSLYLAAWLSNKLKKKKDRWQSLAVFSVVLGILAAELLLQPDMSTLGIIFIAGALIYFVAPTPLWHNLLIIFGSSGAAALLIKIAPYRLARLISFLNPHLDPLGIGYQTKQALITIGSGKIFGIENGAGFGLSRQKFGFLPHSMSDSIFAIIGEEMGFVGTVVLISLFLIFAWRALRISKNCQDNFSKFLGIGITTWIILQFSLNLGGILGLLPLAGIPLPFFSYGGSHLIAEMIGVGILLNISTH